MAHFRIETENQQQLLFRKAATSAPRRIVLRGRIVTMNGRGDVIPDGHLCIEGDRIAQLVAEPAELPPPFAAAPLVDTCGSIYPGLIELHNHPAYNVIPLWTVPEPFKNRDLWRRNDDYKRRVSKPARLLAYHPKDVYPKALVRFVECKALLGGVTTTQGLQYRSNSNLTTYFEGLVRNVEFPNKSWPTATGYINNFKSKEEASRYLTPVLGKEKPYIIHLSEGIDDATKSLFYHLQQEDGRWLIGSELITVHATALDDPEFTVLAQRGCGGIVWSPLSNFLLYGETTKVDLAKKLGIPIAIGSDWAPSGTKNLLGELKIARVVSEHAGGLFSDRELVEAVTCTPANMVGWAPFLGSIEVGKTADLLIVDSSHSDPYANLIGSDESNVIAVLIDGLPRAGRATVIDPRTPGVELITIASQNIVLDVIDSAPHPLAGMSLSCAITTTANALARLPDVAREAQSMARLMSGASDHWRPLLDYDDLPEAGLFATVSLPKPSEVDPLTIEPISAADDDGYVVRLRSNINLPQWMKDAL